MSANTPDDDDAALFRDAIGPVRRIEIDTSPASTLPKPKPRARMAELDEADARDSFRHAFDAQLLEAGDALSYRRDGLPAHAWQRLKKGEISAQEELDLHGSDARQAETLLKAFMTDAHKAGLGCVRVIHGKGRRGDEFVDSRGVPVLKNLVDRVLRHRGDVVAFHSAPAAQGGTGAVLVLLARPKTR